LIRSNVEIVSPVAASSRKIMGSKAIWFGIFIGSAIGGLIPELWGASAFSYSSVLFSGIGAFAGLWIGLKVAQ
jgi:predicted MFS family arabinose efflux permease